MLPDQKIVRVLKYCETDNTYRFYDSENKLLNGRVEYELHGSKTFMDFIDGQPFNKDGSKMELILGLWTNEPNSQNVPIFRVKR